MSSSVDPSSVQSSRDGGKVGMSKSSLDAALEDMVRNLQQSTKHMKVKGTHLTLDGTCVRGWREEGQDCLCCHSNEVMLDCVQILF